MIFTEEVRDLLTVSSDYYLAHCISADFGMGMGIAVEFNKRFDMKNKLMAKYGNYQEHYHMGECILEDRVFNLITKPKYFSKPTYTTIGNALRHMKALCVEYKINKVAMPVIGCGLDRLEWHKVSAIIKDIFADTCKFRPTGVNLSLETV